METTQVLPALTDITQFPVVTETNAIEVFMYDVAQANSNQATFFDSVARYANNIIDAIASTEKYFTWINDVANDIYNSNAFPIWFGSAIGLGTFFLVLNFIRGR